MRVCARPDGQSRDDNTSVCEGGACDSIFRLKTDLMTDYKTGTNSMDKIGQKNWPAMRARNFLKTMSLLPKGPTNRNENLKILADRINITVEELLTMSPLLYCVKICVSKLDANAMALKIIDHNSIMQLCNEDAKLERSWAGIFMDFRDMKVYEENGKFGYYTPARIVPSD